MVFEVAGGAMIRVCMYCKQVIGEVEPISDKAKTHTVCGECEKLIYQYFEKDQDKKLDLMEFLQAEWDKKKPPA